MDSYEAFIVTYRCLMPYCDALYSNRGTRFDMDTWTFDVPGKYAELQSWNTTASVYGVFDADINM